MLIICCIYILYAAFWRDPTTHCVLYCLRKTAAVNIQPAVIKIQLQKYAYFPAITLKAS